MKLRKALAVLLFIGSFSLVAHAIPPVPELDPSIAGSALMLIAGCALIIRGRPKK